MIPIILQTYNRCEYSIQVIAAINNYIQFPHQLIVIDNGSQDGTRASLELMKSLGYINHLILNETNLGISEPKNQGLEIVKELAKTEKIDYVCITDNDIIPPFIRPGCALTEIVKIMDKHPEVGMCGVDLNRDNAPTNQEWWWRLRQHPPLNPTFAEISIGFWFSVIRYEYFQEFKFIGESKYGRVDESLRNWISSVKKCRIGLLKGTYIQERKETTPKLGIHLGWQEDQLKRPDYVLFKKQERYKAELAWKEKDRKW